jgi:hypothetical protein
MYRKTACGSLLYSEPSRAHGVSTGGRRRGHAVADNERLAGWDTQLEPVEQARNRVGAGKAVFLECRGDPGAHRTGYPPDGGALIVRSGQQWPIGDGKQPDEACYHPQCHPVPPIGHNWEMSTAATAITDLEMRYTSEATHVAMYYLRAPNVESPQQRETRVRAWFEVGALATGCAHEVTRVSPAYTDHVSDPWLAAAYRVAITGLPTATDDAQRERLVGKVSRRQVMPATSVGGAV